MGNFVHFQIALTAFFLGGGVHQIHLCNISPPWKKHIFRVKSLPFCSQCSSSPSLVWGFKNSSLNCCTSHWIGTLRVHWFYLNKKYPLYLSLSIFFLGYFIALSFPHDYSRGRRRIVCALLLRYSWWIICNFIQKLKDAVSFSRQQNLTHKVCTVESCFLSLLLVLLDQNICTAFLYLE